MPDWNATPARTDIVNAYRLALGRDPEADGVIDDRIGQRNRDWFPPFFASSEFLDNVMTPIIRGEVLGGGWFDRPPSDDLVAWAAEFVPLSAAGRDAVRAARDWYALFHALYADADFRAAVPPADDAFVTALDRHHRLATATTIRGAIDDVTDGEVRGWARDMSDPDRPLLVELLIDGVFAGSATTDQPRPDLDAPGRPGFMLRHAAADVHDRPATGVVRDVASGVIVGTVRIPGSRLAAIDALAETRRQLSDLRAAIDRIEARLPDIHQAFGFPLAAWDSYYATYFGHQVSGAVEIVDATLLIDLTGADTPALDRMLASVAAQSRLPATLTVIHDAGDLRVEQAMLIERWRAVLAGRVAVSAAVDGLAAALASVSGPLIVCNAIGTLPPDAIERLMTAIKGGARLVYGDDDACHVAPGGRARHSDPRLRGAFDYDLLLQQDSLGPIAAFADARPDPEAGKAMIADAALRLCEAGEAARIVHVPRILFHRDADAPMPDPGAHRAVIDRHLGRTGRQATIEPHRDPLGATVTGALRIRHPLAAGTRVAIVIPTRDRLDLLAPCLGSIARSLPHNRAAIEVVVVDNQSREAETRDYLARFTDISAFRVLAYDGAFNWAAINNYAASRIDTDVLVFLNNDTVAIAPDCWDALAAQAMRAEIGVVGARLLYQDGTIQHAGMVLDPWHSFATHEGVGDAAGDPGYLGRHALARRVSTVTGACIATRAALFRDVGGFDAVAFPAEGNDTDYCLRLRSRGLAILYEPAATLYHFESRSRGYNDDDAKRRRAWLATEELRARWADRYADDPYYNAHFDRLAPPATRLRPPPAIAASQTHPNWCIAAP